MLSPLCFLGCLDHYFSEVSKMEQQRDNIEAMVIPSAPYLSQMPGSDDPDAHQPRQDRVRDAHVSGRQLPPRRQGPRRDRLDEVDVFRVAGAGLGFRRSRRRRRSEADL